MSLNPISAFFAWLPALLIFLLTIIYPLRLYCKHEGLNQNHPLSKLNKFLRRVHKTLGGLVILFTFLHCRISSQKLGFNTGTICLIILTLIFFTYILRRPLKNIGLFCTDI